MDPQTELHEATAFAEFFRAAPAEIQQRSGIERFALGAARGVLTSAFDILAFNRVMGLGVERPATPKDLDLINRRIRDAAAMGCRHVIVETAEDRPDKPGISCRNVQKVGFEIAYLRPNWLFTF